MNIWTFTSQELYALNSYQAQELAYHIYYFFNTFTN